MPFSGQDLDEAIRRRLEKRIYVPLPDKAARTQMFKINLRNIKLDSGLDMNELADLTDGYSGADIHLLCRDWSMAPLRRLIDGKSAEQIRDLQDSPALDFALTLEDFKFTVEKIKPSVDPNDKRKFEKWQKQYGSQ